MMIPILVRYSGQIGLIDQPDEGRKAHQYEISRAGGIAIVISAYIALFLSSVDYSAISGVLAAGAIVFLCGLLDDKKTLNHWWKFIGQIVAAALAIKSSVLLSNLPFIGEYNVSYWIAAPITLVFIVGVTNAINLSDGLDGLAGGSAFLSLGLIAVLGYLINEYVIAIFAVAIMGGIAGFLRYNTHPATIFMGDSGSQFIGFTAACLAVMVTQSENSIYSPLLPLLILGLPVLDTAYVMLVRLRNGQSPFMADASHLHHRLVRLGFFHNEAVAAYYCMQVALLLIAYLSRSQPDTTLLLVYVAFCAVLIGSLVFAKRVTAREGDNDTANQSLAVKSGPRDVSLYPYEDRDRRNPIFRWLGVHFRLATNILSIGLLGILFVGALFSFGMHIDRQTESLVSAIALLLMVTYAVAWKKLQHQSHWLLRLNCSAAGAIVLYHSSLIDLTSPQPYLIDAILLTSLIFLALCIRISRKSVFALTTQDLLIVLILLSVQILPIAEVTKYLMMRITIFVFILEYLIAVQKPMKRMLNIGSILSLMMMSVI